MKIQLFLPISIVLSFHTVSRPKKTNHPLNRGHERKGARSRGFFCASQKVRRSRKLPAFAKASAGQTVHERNPDLSAMLDLVTMGHKNHLRISLVIVSSHGVGAS